MTRRGALSRTHQAMRGSGEHERFQHAQQLVADLDGALSAGKMSSVAAESEALAVRFNRLKI